MTVFFIPGCPTSVFIESSSSAYKPGSVLTCTSDGDPQTAYEWTDAASGSVVGAGREVTLEDGEFYLTCKATAQFDEPCSAWLTVDNLPADESKTFTRSINL